MTNKIYVVDENSNNIAVIDGVTNKTTKVVVGANPVAVAVNLVTNKIYVADMAFGNKGSVTVIDGTIDKTVTLAAGFLPDAVAVNPGDKSNLRRETSAAM